jgi:hypothetical protein
MFNPLLNDEFAPITSMIGFLEHDAHSIVGTFVDWQKKIQAARGVSLVTRELTGSLQDKLVSLLPLTNVEARRFLFLPTKSNWTTYVENGHAGTDFSAVQVLTELLSCRGIEAGHVPHTIRKVEGRELGRFGATILSIFPPPNMPSARRAVSLVNDGGPWVFDLIGEALPFENLKQYEARRIRDRFPPETLDEYLRHLGIRMFEPDFYETGQPAFLVEKQGPCAPGLKKFTLAEAREHF